MKLLRLEQAYPVERMRPWPRNYRQHDLDALARSLERGQHRTVVVREPTGEVLAGNGVYHVAMEKGWPSLAASLVECDDEEAVELAVADNRSQQLGKEDPGLLAALLEEIDSRGRLEAVGYDREYLDGLLAEVNRPMGGIGDPDDVPAPPKEPITKPGDLWLLGEHRVICGDVTSTGVLESLLGGQRPDMVFTDPPYGVDVDVDYDGRFASDTSRLHPTGRRFTRVHGDDHAFDPRPLMATFADVREQFWWGADYYCTRLPEGGSWVVWDKRGNDLGMNLDAVVGASFELCWSRQSHKRDIARLLWSGHHGMQGEDTKRRVHPTQKPVALARWFFDRWGTKGDKVLDLFAGSGSTLIAAVQAERVAYLADVDAQYVDVICRRYEEQVHQQPVLERTGEPHSFTAYEPVASEEYGPALATAVSE